MSNNNHRNHFVSFCYQKISFFLPALPINFQTSAIDQQFIREETTISTSLKGKHLEKFVNDLRNHRSGYSANDYSYANEVLKISLNTYKKCIQSLHKDELTLQRSKLINILSHAELDPAAYGLNLTVGGADNRFGNYQKSKFNFLCGRYLIYRRSFLTARDITCGVLDIAQSKIQDCLSFVERHHYMSEEQQAQNLEYTGDIYMDEGQALLSLPAFENGKVRLMQLVPERVDRQVKLRGALLTFGSPRGIWQPTVSCVYAVGPSKNDETPTRDLCRTINNSSKDFREISSHLEHVERFTTILTPLMFAND